MHVPRIYHPENLASNTTVSLTSQASKHLTSVLRLKIGDTVILFNGQGGQYTGRLSAINKGRGVLQALVEIQDYENVEFESPLNIHLGQAILRADKMDYVIQKAVELGVSQITLLMTERTEVKLSAERLQSKILHWQQIIISACEQCGRNHIPKLHTAMNFNEWIKESKNQLVPEPELKLLLTPQAENKLSDLQKSCKNILILVGAEGGFSDQEIRMVRQADFLDLRLGPRILRTETAALAMIAAIQALWGDY